MEQMKSYSSLCCHHFVADSHTHHDYPSGDCCSVLSPTQQHRKVSDTDIHVELMLSFKHQSAGVIVKKMFMWMIFMSQHLTQTLLALRTSMIN